MSAKTSLVVRIGVVCAVMAAATIGLLCGATLWLFSLSSERILDNHLAAYADMIVSQVETHGNTIQMRDGGKALAGLPRYWQISAGGKPLYHSQNLKTWLPLLSEDLADSLRLEQTVDGKDIIALQTTYLFPNGRKVTLTSGMDASVARAYQEQERGELSRLLYRVMAAGAAALALGCIALAWLALRPLAAVRAELQSVRAGRAARLGEDYPAEIAGLTEEINRLLDYTAGSLARHRELSANLAHSLKTPLTVIANETDIKVIKAKLRDLTDVVERSLARAHAAGASNVLGVSTPVLPALRDIGESFGKVYGRDVSIDFPEGISFRGDRADLYEVLGNIIENACKYSRHRVAIGHAEGAVVVEDDGPGIPEAQRAHVLQRGARLDETAPGQGIGLAVASDILALYQGRIALETSALGGLKALIFLPLAR